MTGNPAPRTKRKEDITFTVLSLIPLALLFVLLLANGSF